MRLLAAGIGVGILVLAGTLAASAAVITSFVSLLDAGRGLGWAPHPEQTAGGTEQFVTGPLTPPAGTGSLQMSVATSTDRALILTVPKPGSGDTPPGSLFPFLATPWGDLNGSFFSTFTTDTAPPGTTTIPGLRFVGYQNFNSNFPLTSTGFTTLNFEGVHQGTVVPNQWQKWTLGLDSLVWQSNESDNGFCPITAPCTLRDFAAHYPDGAWGLIGGGLGSGVPANSTGNVDDVHVFAGTTEFVYDFEVTAPPDSTTSTTVASSSTTATTVASSGVTASGEALARTGSHAGEALAIALICIGFGTLLTVMARRRSSMTG